MNNRNKSKTDPPGKITSKVPEKNPKSNNQPPKIEKPKKDRAEKNVLSNKKITATPPNLTTMEVHHHPQLEHKPKPWKEYLLEGFMIFIAVMMGFIAENIRETIDNHEHVKQLTSQLIQDLKVDTAQLNKIELE